MDFQAFLNPVELSKLRDSVFVFEKGKTMYGVTFPKGDFISIPTVKIFDRYIKENFPDLFIEDEENKLDPKFKKAVVSELHSSITLSNQYSYFLYSRDPFAEYPRVVKRDILVEYIKDGIYIAPFAPTIDISTEEAKEIIDDYKDHFPEVTEVIKWVVACRFNAARRSSYLYIRVNAGFGKSFFLSLLEDLGIAVKVKGSQLKDNSAGDLSPAMFRNAFALAIDEFTHFAQELKDMTNTMSLSAKFQLAERVQVYAKIFLSAEKSSSFFGEAGVDAQIAERVNLIDLSNSAKISERPVYNRNKKKYEETLKLYFHKIIATETQKYIDMGRNESAIKSDMFMNHFNTAHKINANAIEKIKEAVHEVLRDYVEYIENQNNEIRQTTNRLFNELQNDIVVDSSVQILIKRPTKVFERVIREIGDQFYKVAKFKQTDLDEIFGKLEVFKRGGKTIKAIRVNLATMEREVPVHVMRPDGTMMQKTTMTVNAETE